MNCYIGWDVGGWNCDRNRTSRDALCALKGDTWDTLALVGNPWRGNLREALVAENGTLNAILGKTQIVPAKEDTVTWAIDTPLGWPNAFRNLIGPNRDTVNVPEQAGENPYLLRLTEQWLFHQGFRPLSAVRDMIGSQSTKGIHFLHRYGFNREHGNIGIWKTDGHTVIETYPAPARESDRLQAAFAQLQGNLLQQPAAAGINALRDVQDSLWCALVAAMFALDRNGLCPPDQDIPPEEGWIWVPTD